MKPASTSGLDAGFGGLGRGVGLVMRGFSQELLAQAGFDPGQVNDGHEIHGRSHVEQHPVAEEGDQVVVLEPAG